MAYLDNLSWENISQEVNNDILSGSTKDSEIIDGLGLNDLQIESSFMSLDFVVDGTCILENLTGKNFVNTR